MSYDNPAIPSFPAAPFQIAAQNEELPSLDENAADASRPFGTKRNSRDIYLSLALRDIIAVKSLPDDFLEAGQEWRQTVHELLLKRVDGSDSSISRRALEFAEKLESKYRKRDPLYFTSGMGTLLYALDRGKIRDIKLLNPKKIAISLQALEVLATRDLKKIQRKRVASPHTLPLELAKFLLLGNGSLNVGMIVPALLLCEIDIKNPSGRELNIVKSLRQFARSPHLCQKLAEIQKPKSPHCPVNQIIREMLGMSMEQEVTDLHAKQAVLSALLTHLRQGKESACYAVSVAIQTQLSELSLCIEDMGSLIRCGYIVRKEGRVTRQFPLLLSPTSFDSSEKENLLQTAWRNIIASMAESGSNGVILSSVVNAVRISVRARLLEKFPDEEEYLEELVEQISRILLGRAHIEFDPGAGLDDMKVTGRTKEGAFVLYDRQNQLIEWKRIHCFEAFATLMEQVLEESLAFVSRDQAKKARLFLKDYFRTEQFLRRLLAEYHPSNGSLTQIKKARYTPWITPCGNDLFRVLRVYLGREKFRRYPELVPKDAGDLCQRLIEQQKSLPPLLLREYEKNRNLLFPVRIPGVHAFSTMIGHPTFAAAWRSDLSAEAWLKQNLLKKGRQIAKTVMEEKQREALVQYCCLTFLPSHLANRFVGRTAALSPTLSIHRFRKKIVEILEEMHPKPERSRKKRIRLIDRKLLATLPSGLRKRMSQAALHFADSNWADKGRDVHFCFVVNPGSGKMEVWGIRHDKGKLFPLDQEIWVEGQKWEFFQKEELLLWEDPEVNT